MTTSTRNGLTLIEMVVVLTILVVLATVAIASSTNLLEQARFEATQTTLQNVEEALVGNRQEKNADGTPRVRGFVFDVGALPSGADPVSSLLVQPAGVISATVQTFDSDRDGSNDVSLTSGWNGGYLQMPVGQTSVVDGWGQALLVTSGASWVVTSQGSDGDSLAPETGYAEDLMAEVTDDEYLTTIVFRLFSIDGTTGTRIDPAPTGTQKLGVLFYGVNANGGSDASVQEQMLLVPFPSVTVSGQTIDFEHRRTNSLGGNFAARAILWDDTNSDNLLTTGESIVAKSYVFHATLIPNFEQRIELELR